MKWGLLGASRILQRAILPAMRAAGQTPAFLAARDPARANALAAEWNIPASGTYQACLADPNLSAIYISTTNDTHWHWIVQALHAGKHVLCEKPLTLDAAEVERVRQAETATGHRVMEAFVYGFHPQIPDALNALHTGAIGDLVTIETIFAFPLENPQDFRWDPALGGGALLDIGTYCISLIRDAARRQPLRVAATAQHRNRVDATMTALLDFGPFTATMTCSFAAARTQSCRIVGTAGTIELETPFSSNAKPLTTCINGTPHLWPPCDPYRHMLEHFATATTTNTPLRHDTSEALHQAQTLDALRTSAHQSRVVTIPQEQ